MKVTFLFESSKFCETYLSHLKNFASYMNRIKFCDS